MPNDWDSLLEERLRRLEVPEHDVVPVGIGGAVRWRPEHEEEPKPGKPCPKCEGKIEPGSNRFCPKCKASGFDGKLFEQRMLAPGPAPERTVPKPKPKREPDKPKKRAGRPKRTT